MAWWILFHLTNNIIEFSKLFSKSIWPGNFHILLKSVLEILKYLQRILGLLVCVASLFCFIFIASLLTQLNTNPLQDIFYCDLVLTKDMEVDLLLHTLAHIVARRADVDASLVSVGLLYGDGESFHRLLARRQQVVLNTRCNISAPADFVMQSLWLIARKLYWFYTNASNWVDLD